MSNTDPIKKLWVNSSACEGQWAASYCICLFTLNCLPLFHHQGSVYFIMLFISHFSFLFLWHMIYSEFSESVQNFQQCSEFSVMFRIRSEFSAIFRICSEFSVMFRIFSNFQNFQTLFRISSTKTSLFRISWLCSDMIYFF